MVLLCIGNPALNGAYGGSVTFFSPLLADYTTTEKLFILAFIVDCQAKQSYGQENLNH